MIEYNKHYENTMYINYDITLACNNRCDYCYNLMNLDNKTGVDNKTFDNVITAIDNFVNEHPDFKVTVNLLGGEPLLVKDKVVEFLERVPESVRVFVYGNLSYNTKPLHGLEEYKNLTIVCSWHESSNPDFVKENLLSYTGSKEMALFITDETFDTMYEYGLWAAANNIAFRLEPVREPAWRSKSVPTHEYLFTQFESDKYKELFEKGRSLRAESFVQFEDFTNIGLSFDELRRVSKYYHTFCKINQYHIGYNGVMFAACEYPYRGRIEDGIPVSTVYCNGYTCICDITAYKKLRIKNNTTIGKK